MQIAPDPYCLQIMSKFSRIRWSSLRFSSKNQTCFDIFSQQVHSSMKGSIQFHRFDFFTLENTVNRCYSVNSPFNQPITYWTDQRLSKDLQDTVLIFINPGFQKQRGQYRTEQHCFKHGLILMTVVQAERMDNILMQNWFAIKNGITT